MFKRFLDFIVRRYNRYITIPAAHKKFDGINILNSIDSIKYIIEHKCSVSRYGDGEIVMLLGGDILAIKKPIISWQTGYDR